MTKDPKNPNSPQLAELVVRADRHQQLQDIVSYVKGIHHHIDLDMYCISMKKLEELEWCVEGVEFESEGFKECYGFTMQVSWEDLRFLELVVEARTPTPIEEARAGGHY